jgi:phage FluMu gp28-like protein
LPRFRRGCFDRSGIGRQFAERAQERFGLQKIEGIDFTPATKEELAYPIRAAFEDRTTRVPDDRFVIADHRAIKKEQTAGDNVRFSADRGKNGHADRFWAHALCRHASKTPSGKVSCTII